MNDETDRQLALRVLRDTLRDSRAKAAERVSAAKLLLEHDRAQGAGPGALHSMSAAELLSVARGEGGTPPEMGPAESPAVAVPSRAREPQISQPAPPIAPSPALVGPSVPAASTATEKDILGRTPGRFLQRGPKTDPPISPTPGGVPAMGPKTDPSISVDIDPLS